MLPRTSLVKKQNHNCWFSDLFMVKPLAKLNVTRSSFLFFVAMFASRLTTFIFTVQFCFQVFQSLVAFVDCTFFSCVSCTQIYEDEKIKTSLLLSTVEPSTFICDLNILKRFFVSPQALHLENFVNNAMRREIKHSQAFL